VASTSVASTAFVLFAMPESEAARAWNTLGGNVLGLLAGLLVSAIGLKLGVPDAGVYALTVGLAMFAMQAARALHPPAAGAALTVPLEALRGHFGFEMAGSILLSVVLLLAVQRSVQRWLR
jgi:CBS domain-containing membrane protein